MSRVNSVNVRSHGKNYKDHNFTFVFYGAIEQSGYLIINMDNDATVDAIARQRN